MSYGSGQRQIQSLVVGVGIGYLSTVQFRLARTDSTSGDILAVFVDAHVERDTVGSRTEFVK